MTAYHWSSATLGHDAKPERLKHGQPPAVCARKPLIGAKQLKRCGHKPKKQTFRGKMLFSHEFMHQLEELNG
ncbi:hypothetical protein RCH06_002133 [Polaromonas sp. CG_9.5]|uniref:hypothetical protein n=1 Tax=Polaromonas sp. CG_9.5 TaxID=3071705 RepID=UPI002E01913A|nr:hypothetical protein [Polaromonas sp. CG_9.5]